MVRFAFHRFFFFVFCCVTFLELLCGGGAGGTLTFIVVSACSTIYALTSASVSLGLLFSMYVCTIDWVVFFIVRSFAVCSLNEKGCWSEKSF